MNIQTERNEEQTDAKYKITGTTLAVSFKDKNGQKHDINYIQPNKNQCKSCHNKKEQLLPIGPKARNLNFRLDYGNGVLVNQLEKWAEIGYLSNFEAESICLVCDESIWKPWNFYKPQGTL